MERPFIPKFPQQYSTNNKEKKRHFIAEKSLKIIHEFAFHIKTEKGNKIDSFSAIYLTIRLHENRLLCVKLTEN
eukprot:snap_masked-scaffold_10-processed-gene-2.21-mRNA-1 protein AED:1.00 eAED:1.00 QI:0/0/0/0/1/1/2/0/73